MVKISFIIFSGLYLISIYNYLIFHFCIEMFTITVSWCTFFIVWSVRHKFKSGFFLVVGISYLFFGYIELLHMLSYKGMGIFKEFDSNLPTQLWIAAGYFTSISFIVATLFISRPLHITKGFLAFLIVSILILITIFGGFFPDCFIEGSGLTDFKKISEVIICSIFFASIIKIHLNSNFFSSYIKKLLLIGLIFDIAARISFIFYISVYGFSNLMGHFFQLISFYYIYLAFVEKSISSPFELLSNQLKTEIELSEDTKQEFKNLFENMTEAIAYHRIITNDQHEPIDYIFINVNEQYEKYIGLKRSMLINKSFSEVLPEEYKQSKPWIKIFGKVAEDMQNMTIDHYSEKHSCWFEISIFSPEKGYFSTILSNITEQKNNELILQKKYFQLEDSIQNSIKEIHEKNLELERNKEGLNELATLFSQKLARPISEIFKLTNNLNDKLAQTLDKKQLTLLKYINQSSYRLNSQINSILSYLQMDLNEMDRKIVDTNYVLKNLLGSMSDLIESQNAMIVFQKMPIFFCNEFIIRKIFFNLISNAIKYNDNKIKHINIGCLMPDKKVQDNHDTNNMKPYIFYVKDNGIGIPAKHFENIFRFFYRLHPKDKYGGGLGSGLTLVKKMVELHGGWILVDSEIGHGSTFYFMLM